VATAIIFVALLVPLSVLQFALVCGAPWGRFAWGGQYRVLPVRLRVGSAVSLLLYVAFAVVILDRAGRIDVLAESVAVVGSWAVFGVMALSVVANALSRSKPERYTATPAALALAVTSLFVALGSGGQA
jgi:ABC-type transport system involved in cytochrome c biogenesis permease subunit